MYMEGASYSLKLLRATDSFELDNEVCFSYNPGGFIYRLSTAVLES